LQLRNKFTSVANEIKETNTKIERDWRYIPVALKTPLLLDTLGAKSREFLAMDLWIGRLTSPFAEAAAGAFDRRGLRYSPEWNCPENIARIDVFNLASVNVFLEHASKIGHPSTKFRHLPTHIYNGWLPFDFEPTAEPEISDGHWPVPLLSSFRLLAELDQMKRLSYLDFEKVPSSYELMRNNPREFYKSDIRLDENAVIQWIWYSLRDAAELSIRNSAPVLATE
jgi:hypothetical protein